jgi:hypothetical protein
MGSFAGTQNRTDVNASGSIGNGTATRQIDHTTKPCAAATASTVVVRDETRADFVAIPIPRVVPKGY